MDPIFSRWLASATDFCSQPTREGEPKSIFKSFEGDARNVWQVEFDAEDAAASSCTMQKTYFCSVYIVGFRRKSRSRPITVGRISSMETTRSRRNSGKSLSIPLSASGRCVRAGGGFPPRRFLVREANPFRSETQNLRLNRACCFGAKNICIFRVAYNVRRSVG